MVLLIPRRKTVRNETPVEGGARVPGVASFLESQVPPADVLTEMIGGEELTRCYVGKTLYSHAAKKTYPGRLPPLARSASLSMPPCHAWLESQAKTEAPKLEYKPINDGIAGVRTPCAFRERERQMGTHGR
ncbi:hypothetical protein V1478_000336 [Vespula squamosa]|uniref:Uncharacterized protein n=1 Tax=Vespula squamosa TaxID=30214 RepID=A0ABD2C5C2_VESSQ